MSNFLIIDEIENSSLLSKALKDMGYHVTVMPPCPASLLFKSGEYKPMDLIILSEGQEEQSGYNICKELRKILESKSVYIPILLRVKNEVYSDEVFTKAQEAGADDIFFNTADGVLQSKVRSLLRIKRLNDQLRENISVIQATNEIFSEQLRIARQVQRAFVHEDRFCCNNVDFYSRYLPALEIGGDFYEILKVNDHLVAVVIGDVQGHGISAALLTAMISLIIKQLAPKYINPPQFMYHMNKEFCAVFSKSQTGVPVYTSMFYALIDTERKKIYYSNAGLTLPIFVDAELERASELEIGGIPIGMMEETQYEQGIKPFAEGDMILFYTDGLADNVFKHNPEEFYRRVTDMLLDMSGGTPSNVIIDSLIGVFNKPEKEADRYKLDDVSLIICKM